MRACVGLKIGPAPVSGIRDQGSEGGHLGTKRGTRKVKN